MPESHWETELRYFRWLWIETNTVEFMFSFVDTAEPSVLGWYGIREAFSRNLSEAQGLQGRDTGARGVPDSDKDRREEASK